MDANRRARAVLRDVRLYEQPDPTAPLRGELTYRLVEIENTGRSNVYGPFSVLLDGAQSLSQWLAAAGLGVDADPDADDVPATPPVNELHLAPEHGARVYRVRLK